MLGGIAYIIHGVIVEASKAVEEAERQAIRAAESREHAFQKKWDKQTQELSRPIGYTRHIKKQAEIKLFGKQLNLTKEDTGERGLKYYELKDYLKGLER